MVDIKPFRAIRYTEKAGNIEKLITPPYDKIDATQQKSYYEKSSYNYCRLILPLEEDAYEIANQRIQQWLKEGILKKDDTPAFFVYKQTFMFSGKILNRTGLIVALRLHAYEENKILPHEITHSAPKADRLKMLRKVQKDLEPVFLIFSDDENEVTKILISTQKTTPIIEVKDEFNVKHIVWSITDTKTIKKLQNTFKNKTLVITDGHHRYESALAYRNERRMQETCTEDAAFNFHMSYIVPLQDQGLIVLPTHRLLKKHEVTDQTLQELAKFFKISEIQSKIEEIDQFLEKHKQKHAFCIYNGSKTYALTIKDENTIRKSLEKNQQNIQLLVVTILRDLVFKNIMRINELRIEEDIIYADSTRSAMEKVNSGAAKVAFIVSCIGPETVWKLALKRQILPEKSTNFYPKPVSGLMMMDISPNEQL
ncbi:MAG: DUF1015 domain-containing protein [Candidatus Bathyarchaeia archaeon]